MDEYILASETDAYNIGGKKKGSPVANKLLRYDKVSNFNCNCVNRGQTSNQIVRYVDLSAIVSEYWGVFVGLFDKWNHWPDTQFPAIKPLYSTLSDPISISWDDISPIEFKDEFFYYSDPCDGMNKFFEFYGSDYPNQELSHFSVYWPEQFPDYEQQCIDEYWVSAVQGGNDIFNYPAFTNLVELGFLGWNVSKPYESFQNAPQTLQLMELGAGYSYVMRDPNDVSFVCTCNAGGLEYHHWYDAHNYNYTLTFLDDGVSEDWINGREFFYDNAPHILEAGDNIWRTNIPNMQSIIDQSIDNGYVQSDSEYYLSGSGCIDCLEYPDMFELNQGHPFHSIPSEAQYSSLYVPHIYEMFSHILERNWKTWPEVRVEADSSIVIPLGTKEYYEPSSNNQPIAYTLCIFRLGGTEPEIIKTTADKKFVAAITTWDYKGTAVRENTTSGMRELWFSAGTNLYQNYSSVYTPEYETIWNEVAAAVKEIDQPYDLCYSLYIQCGCMDADIDNARGFENTDYNSELFPSTFRIDFNWNFRSAIFYATWRHPFNDIRFG